jgi:chromosome segregation ATPase
MAFSVDDFHTLVRLLEQHPEWRADLRRLLLTEELLDLPQAVRALAEQVARLAEAQARTEARVTQLAEAQARTEARVTQLAEAQARTEARVTQLAEAQARTEARVAQLAEAQARTEARVTQLAEAQARTEARVTQLAEAQARTEARVTQLAEAQARTEGELQRLTGVVGALRGELLELRYQRRAAALFQALLRRIRLLDHQTLGQLLDDAVDAGRLGPEDKSEILRADVVVSGQREGHEVYLLAEVSAVVDRSDVERAARRARLLEQATGVPTLAAVAGERILGDAEASARAAGVFAVRDGALTESS